MPVSPAIQAVFGHFQNLNLLALLHDTLEQAFVLYRQQEQVYDQRLKEFRDRAEQAAAPDEPRE